MGGKKSRDKGKRGERAVIDLLQPVVSEVFAVHDKVPPRLKRNTLQSDSGGDDIAIEGLEWLSIEVKNHATLALSTWWRQCESQAGQGKTPVLIYNSGHGKWLVMMRVMLPMPNDSGWFGVSSPAIINMPMFLVWLRRTLTWRLT